VLVEGTSKSSSLLSSLLDTSSSEELELLSVSISSSSELADDQSLSWRRIFVKSGVKPRWNQKNPKSCHLDEDASLSSRRWTRSNAASPLVQVGREEGRRLEEQRGSPRTVRRLRRAALYARGGGRSNAAPFLCLASLRCVCPSFHGNAESGQSPFL